VDRTEHLADALGPAVLIVPLVKFEADLRELVGRPARERPLPNRHAVLAGLILLEAGLEPHVEGRVVGDRLRTRDAVHVLIVGGQALADEAGPAVNLLEDFREVGRRLHAVHLRLLAQQALLGRQHDRGVVAGEVDHGVLPVEFGVLEWSQRPRFLKVHRVGQLPLESVEVRG
jgi:hypothetical protein